MDSKHEAKAQYSLFDSFYIRDTKAIFQSPEVETNNPSEIEAAHASEANTGTIMGIPESNRVA